MSYTSQAAAAVCLCSLSPGSAMNACLQMLLGSWNGWRTRCHTLWNSISCCVPRSHSNCPALYMKSLAWTVVVACFAGSEAWPPWASMASIGTRIRAVECSREV